jgi:penicillin-binding protein 1C
MRGIRRLPEWVRLSAVGLVALGFFAVGGTITWAAFMPIPAISNFENRAVAESTKIYDRTGNIVLYDVHGTVRRTSVPLEKISPYVQKATIAIEDVTFYEHMGFRPLSFMRAVWADITTGSFAQGGSTITQQVVKNALLTQEKTIIRKLKEIILAVRLDRLYSKDEILMTYLNENPYGGTIYGVQEASQYFFGVDASDVTLAEAAYIAALPQAPTYYSPYGNHRDALTARKNRVLAEMLDHDFITEEEYDEAMLETVQFKDQAEAGIKAPHFVFYVREYLEAKYGVDAVVRDGLHVVTTLDYDLQEKAEEVVATYAPEMERNFNASNEGIVAIEPSSGQILTMVGSRGYFDKSIDGMVNVTTSHQQPGSAFKPIVYATALEKGYTPETVVFDVRTQFSTRCSPSDSLNSTPPCYSPVSFDDAYKGPVTFREALAQSLNIPAVKVLYLVGIDNALNMASRLGISTLTTAAEYGLSLVLGGGDVTLLDLTGAYATLANDGVRNPPVAILRVEGENGRILEEYEDRSERAVDSQVARQINDILSDNVARTPEFGSNSPLYFPGENVAAKTGTTNDYWDVWILGYTPGVAVGAWAGNNNNEPMEKRIAAFIIAPMWHEFTEYAIEKYPAADFTPPAPDPELDSLPPVMRGQWNGYPSEGVHSILYWVSKDNPRAGRPANPWSDGQLPYWEYPVGIWAASGGLNGGATTPGVGQNLRIMTPGHGTFVFLQQPMLLSAQYTLPQNLIAITYYINDIPVGSSNQPPYAVTYVPTAPGPTILRASAETTMGIESQQISFIVQ